MTMSKALSAGDIVVIKVGSSSLVREDGRADDSAIERLCDAVAALHSRGIRPIIVSSGAVACGVERLGLDQRPDDIALLQACSAAGQASLTERYAVYLARHGIPCGQVLLTRGDIMSRTSYLNARGTLEALMGYGAIPVVNENDTVSSAEFSFGDNDMLGAIVSAMVHASLYVILSDIDGLYEANPRIHADAPLIPLVTCVDERIMSLAGGSGSSMGTGGMATKVKAARAMLAANIPMVIASSAREGVIQDLAAGKDVGTRFGSEDSAVGATPRQLWIGLAEVTRGAVVIDDGALRALLGEGASLLPVGITSTMGSFEPGDVVDVRSAAGVLVARGRVRYGSDELERVRGLRLDVIARFFPDRVGEPCIHRDELLVF